jgi:hypothetical protein
MRTLLLLAVFMLCACIVTAQVNFTPTWGQGKRNAPASVQATDECKSMDTLIYIYKLVQVNYFVVSRKRTRTRTPRRSMSYSDQD